LLLACPGKVILLRVGPMVDLDAAAQQMEPGVERAADLPGDEYDLLSNAPELEIRRYLEAIGERLAKTGATSVVEVSFSKPAEEILFFARHYGADLIAMATHGRSGIDRLLHGSVAESVMRHAPCPVLLVRTPDEPLPRFAPEHQQLEQPDLM
jgi:nucleotide-binding universal stress UspA family protein